MGGVGEGGGRLKLSYVNRNMVYLCIHTNSRIPLLRINGPSEAHGDEQVHANPVTFMVLGSNGCGVTEEQLWFYRVTVVVSQLGTW
jgi:hypothetical protein